jgi:phosphoesterase RecJ-like protein
MINGAVFQKAIELIKKSERILLTTHIRPDGDACGCMVALGETLTALGKNVKMLLLSELPGWYEFLFEQTPEIFSSPFLLSQESRGADLIIIVDTASYSQLPGFDKYLKQSEGEVLVVDHHATSDDIGGIKLIDSSAAAAALIVFDLLQYAGWPITKKTAEALFVAVSTDTGWFQFDNTDSRTFKVCHELINAGAKPAKIHKDLYQNFSPQRFRLMVTMLNTLKLHLEGRFAMQHLSRADFERTGTKYSDTENLIDECRRISNVEAAALFVEMADGQVKVSLRSRGAVNVCKIAEKFGGGGHKMAAGAHLPGPLDNAKKLVLDAVAEQFKQSA